MINLAEQIEALNSIHIKWRTIKKDGVVSEENLDVLSAVGFPSYSDMQNTDDYENIAVIMCKQEDGFEEVTAILYGNDSYRLDVYDQEEILGVHIDEDTDPLELSADTLEKAESEAEEYIIEGIYTMLECAQRMANRYLQGAV